LHFEKILQSQDKYFIKPLKTNPDRQVIIQSK